MAETKGLFAPKAGEEGENLRAIVGHRAVGYLVSCLIDRIKGVRRVRLVERLANRVGTPEADTVSYGFLVWHDAVGISVEKEQRTRRLFPL